MLQKSIRLDINSCSPQLINFAHHTTSARWVALALLQPSRCLITKDWLAQSHALLRKSNVLQNRDQKEILQQTRKEEDLLR